MGWFHTAEQLDKVDLIQRLMHEGLQKQLLCLNGFFLVRKTHNIVVKETSAVCINDSFYIVNATVFIRKIF